MCVGLKDLDESYEHDLSIKVNKRRNVFISFYFVVGWCNGASGVNMCC